MLDNSNDTRLFYQVEFLHDCLDDYLDQVLALLGQEWPKFNRKTRLESLKKSNNNFPINLILVNEHKQCVAHCRMSRVDSELEGVLVESVIVDKNYRGKGYGKAIMMEAEHIAIEKRMSSIYLSTFKREFYKKLGYRECHAVTSLSSNADILSKTQLRALLGVFGGHHQINNSDRVWMSKRLG
ncbi:N-alpha-acetyltransferase 80-like [Schistocerca gregaria]|uniref:N-alpha-acetyltransferase 80-like n=1 Tax=Schistocerca gregaria TaxID=7010 RepID=UPI00211F0DD2|nr:N-alpha-acetyltransferase 80-like [Schistocerca gregaria]